MNELALFAGAGGGILGSHLLGWRTVCAVEWEPYPASVLVQRQNDGILPSFPIWDDVQTFDGRPWRGIVDVVSGGFPCQDISSAGGGAGIGGSRSSMWGHMARIIGEVRPRFAWVENSPMLTTRGLGRVLADLSEMGYDAKWGVVGASHVGANHERERIWILACDTNMHVQSIGSVNDEASRMPRTCKSNASDSNVPQRERRQLSSGKQSENPFACYPRWWKDSSPLHRMDDGVAARMDRLKAIGNGQVPAVVRAAFQLLRGDMHYYKRNIGDYAKKAGRLSMLEHGAYTLLIDACYDRERFPNEQEAIEWAWARSDAEIEAVRFVLSRFFVLIDGVYVQERIKEEIDAYARNAETNARIAREREEKRTKRTRSVNGASPSEHEPPPNHKPLTTNQEPIITAPQSDAKKRGSRLADDWVLPKPWGEWALSQFPNWSVQEIRTESEKFRDFWVAKSGKDAAKLDWEATWRNWCRNAKKDIQTKPVSQNSKIFKAGSVWSGTKPSST